jgi:eukaryotic-like serine/threonine-protein kinase
MIMPDQNRADHRAVEFERICRRFESAWQDQAAPLLEGFLPAEADPLRESVLRELVHLDLEFRLRARMDARVEDYIERYPQLTDSREWILELIEEEYALRQETDRSLSPTEYIDRFPPLARELQQRLPGRQSYPADTYNLGAAASRSEPTRPELPGCEILHVLGRGGMGVVFKARQTALDRIVAVKMMRAGILADADERRRFQAEVRAAALLQHPHIVQIHEVGEWQGQPYCLMEYVDGGSLQRRVANGPLPPREAACLLEPIARAAHFAHRQGIIHRDLKPANVLLQNADPGSKEGDVQSASGNPQAAIPKIADFGLAKKLGGDGSQTETGAIIGTVPYMAPEQASADSVTAAADVYALGAILYETLTGRPPFQGPTPLETLEMVRTREPFPPTRLQPKVPRDLETICLKCLEKKPEHRYPSAEALADDLSRFLAGEPVVARPIGRAERVRRWCGRNPALAGLLAMVALALIAALGAAFWFQHDRAVQEADALARQAEALRKHDLAEQRVDDALRQARQMRAALHAELMQAGGVFRLLNEPARWSASIAGASAALERARAVNKGTDAALADDLVQQLQALALLLEQDDADRKLALRLEKIRLDRSTWIDGQFNLALAEREYPRAFLHMGVTDLHKDQAEAALAASAKRLQDSPIKEQLLAALDDWAYVSFGRGDKGLTEKLLTLARRVDPDPWRDQVRDLARWNKPAELHDLVRVALADEKNLVRLSPQIIFWTGRLVARQAPGDGADKERLETAEEWLRRGLMLYPADFWINFELGTVLHAERPAEAAGYYRTAVAVRPHSGAAWNNLGIIARIDKQYSSARRILQRAIDAEPENGQAWSNLGLTLLDLNDLTAAADAAHKAVKYEPKNASAWNNLGLVLTRQKERAAAGEAWKKAVKLDPQNSIAWYNLGTFLREKKHTDGALDAFEKAIALNPRYVNAWTYLGLALRDRKEFAEAIKAHRKAIEIAPASSFAWNHLGRTLHLNEDIPGAIAAFDKAIACDENNTSAWNNLGVSRRANKDLTGAIAAYEKALALDANYVNAWLNLAGALIQRKDKAAAHEACKKALAIDDKNANAWYTLALVLSERPQASDEAIAAYRKAIALEDSFVAAWNNLGMLLRDKKDLDGAIEALQTALKHGPHHANAWANLGGALQDKRDFAGAIEAFKKLLHYRPRDADSWHNLAVCFHNLKELDAAAEAHDKAIDIAPKMGRAHLGLGRARRDQGRFAEAVAATQRGLKLLPLLDQLQASPQLLECQKLLALDQRLAVVLKGDKATDAEQLALADMCLRYKRLYPEAVRFYAAAFAAQPKSMEDTTARHRVDAACAAVLAAETTTVSTRQSEYRRQALDWLHAEMASLVNRQPAVIASWQNEPRLAGVRLSEKLDALPDAEKQAWRSFWLQVEAVRKKD